MLGIWAAGSGTWSNTPQCVREGKRLLANPFGWQMHFMGMGTAQANEVIAFQPPSPGAGLWPRCAALLNKRYRVYTGTYDSFVLAVRNTRSDVEEATQYLVAIMERKWSELGDKTFPCEVEVGMNLGGWHEQHNPYGLKEVA